MPHGECCDARDVIGECCGERLLIGELVGDFFGVVKEVIASWGDLTVALLAAILVALALVCFLLFFGVFVGLLGSAGTTTGMYSDIPYCKQSIRNTINLN